jgi:hypothetical protein
VGTTVRFGGRGATPSCGRSDTFNRRRDHRQWRVTDRSRKTSDIEIPRRMWFQRLSNTGGRRRHSYDREMFQPFIPFLLKNFSSLVNMN